MILFVYQITLKIAIFCYIFSGMLYAVDNTIGAELGVSVITPLDTDKVLTTDAKTITDTNSYYNITNPTDNSTEVGQFAENGTVFDIIADYTAFFQSGVKSITTIAKLLTGTLVFDILTLVGVDPIWIYVIQAPMGILIVITIVDYIRSRI